MRRLPRARGRNVVDLNASFFVLLALTLVAAGVVYWRDGPQVFLEVLTGDSWLLVEILPKVVAGTLIGALVRALMPKPMVRRLVGETSGLTGILVATLAGAIFPGGPFTIFPLAIAFMVVGADRGTVVAFITAWLALGINRALIWELPFFGVDFVAWRMLFSLPLPILAGLLARAVPLAWALPGARS